MRPLTHMCSVIFNKVVYDARPRGQLHVGQGRTKMGPLRRVVADNASAAVLHRCGWDTVASVVRVHRTSNGWDAAYGVKDFPPDVVGQEVKTIAKIHSVPVCQ